MSQWYETLSACYQTRFQSTGERSSFYETVTMATGSNNDEISEAIQNASINEMKTSDNLGRVTTADVIRWVRRLRESKPKRGKSGSESDILNNKTVQMFISDVRQKLKAGEIEEYEAEAKAWQLIIADEQGKQSLNISTSERMMIENTIMHGYRQ